MIDETLYRTVTPAQVDARSLMRTERVHGRPLAANCLAGKLRRVCEPTTYR